MIIWPKWASVSTIPIHENKSFEKRARSRLIRLPFGHTSFNLALIDNSINYYGGSPIKWKYQNHIYIHIFGHSPLLVRKRFIILNLVFRFYLRASNSHIIVSGINFNTRLYLIFNQIMTNLYQSQVSKIFNDS